MMSWKERRAEKKLMMLETQRQKLLEKTGRGQYDDRRRYQDEQRMYQERGIYENRRRSQPMQQHQRVEPMQQETGAPLNRKQQLEQMAQEILESMPKDMTPGEVLYVVTLMIKMVILLIEEP